MLTVAGWIVVIGFGIPLFGYLLIFALIIMLNAWIAFCRAIVAACTSTELKRPKRNEAKR